MSKTTAIETHVPFVAEDRADGAGNGRTPYDGAAATDPTVVVYRISGAFFFGAAASIGSVLERIADTHEALILDFAAVPCLDSKIGRPSCRASEFSTCRFRWSPDP